MTPAYIEIYNKNPEKVFNSYKNLGHKAFFMSVKTALISGGYKEKSASTIAGKLAYFMSSVEILKELGEI